MQIASIGMIDPVLDTQSGVVLKIGRVVGNQRKGNTCGVSGDESIQGIAAAVTDGRGQHAVAERRIGIEGDGGNVQDQ